MANTLALKLNNIITDKKENDLEFSYNQNQIFDIKDLFDTIKIDYSWSFCDKTRKDTAYITHGYHRYPAKFIPQIVSRLAEKYTEQGDLIVDPFGGCGTTLVKSTR